MKTDAIVALRALAALWMLTLAASATAQPTEAAKAEMRAALQAVAAD